MTQPDLAAIEANYRGMDEDELMDVAREYDTLVEPAQDLLRAEFARRGLEPPLIEEEEPLAARGDLETVGRYRDMAEAIVARSVLEQAGVPRFLRDENTVRLDWAISNMIGGMRLQVAPEDAEEAKELLSQPMPASFPVDSGADFEQPICPRCGSLNVSANNTDQKLAAAGTLAGGVFLPVVLPAMAMQREDVWKCNVCGTRWTDDSDG